MKEISQDIQRAVKSLFDIEIQPIITIPEKKFGDYATNIALQLAGRLGKNPREIAEQIAETINYDTSVAGAGFINIKLKDSTIAKRLTDFLAAGETVAANNIYKDKIVVSEFSDPNPFKVLHVGHLYTSIVGDSISRLIETAGGKVIRANFGGDVGLHVGKTMYEVMRRCDEFEALAEDGISSDSRMDFISQCYVAGSRDYEEDETARAEITKLNREIYQINLEDDHSSRLAKFYWLGRKWSYDYFKDFYAKIGLKFDRYYPESSVAELGKEIVEQNLQDGVYEKSQGAIVFKGEKYGLHTRVFINKNGVPTYETKDVGLLFTKWNDYHFDQSIIITADEQLDYMKVVMKSVEQYAPELIEKSLHLTHGMVRLPGDEKMSSRRGNFLKAIDVLNLINKEISQNYDQSNENIALAAVKYAFLKYKMGGNIIFDPTESVSTVGNSGPYLQYALARAKSILRKIGEEKITTLPADQDFDPAERSLAMKLFEFEEVVEKATHELAPHLICAYLYETAQEFNRFYEKSKVEGDPRENLRLNLVLLYIRILSRGFTLLGLPILEKM